MCFFRFCRNTMTWRFPRIRTISSGQFLGIPIWIMTVSESFIPEKISVPIIIFMITALILNIWITATGIFAIPIISCGTRHFPAWWKSIWRRRRKSGQKPGFAALSTATARAILPEPGSLSCCPGINGWMPAASYATISAFPKGLRISWPFRRNINLP